MGVLPLEFPSGQAWQSLGLTGEEAYEIRGLDETLKPAASLTVVATAPDGSTKQFACRSRIDTPVELEYYRNGGILQTVLRKLLAAN
jgi:aconitate hydratase